MLLNIGFGTKNIIQNTLAIKENTCWQLDVNTLLMSSKECIKYNFIAPKCDVVFFQKCVIPYMKKYTFEKLHNSGCKVVFDVDDAVFIEDKDGTVNIAKHSDVVIVGNEMLGDFYKKHNCNVVVIPTVDYTPDYIAYNKDTFHNKILLWLGSAATVDNLDLIIEPINKLIDKHPEVKFKYICDADMVTQH